MSNDKRALFPVHDLEAYHDSHSHTRLMDRAVPLLPEGVRNEDRRPVKEMTDRPALLMLACCACCGLTFIFITSERDTCNYSTTCESCRKNHT
jgi:hypothetical protein